MAKRIYKLAKELNLDSKHLVDICSKAGVEGKGSALASLNDDELARVEAFLRGDVPAAATPAAPSVAAATSTVSPPAETGTASGSPLRREDYIAPGGTSGRPPVITAKQKKPVASPEEADEAVDVEDVSSPPVEVPPVAQTPAPTAPPISAVQTDVPPPPSHEETLDKTLGIKPGGDTDQPPRGKPPKKPTTTGIAGLAPMPNVPAPPPPPQADEPKVQKPVISLPKDAIHGKKPLSDHIRKHEERKRAKADDKDKTGATPGRAGAGKTETPATGAGKRGRRGRGGEGGTDESGKRLLAGGREARQLNRASRSPGRRGRDDDGSSHRRRSRGHRRRSNVNTSAPRKTAVALELPCSVRAFSEAVGVGANQVLGRLLALGQMVNINATLELETAELLAAELGVEITFKTGVSLEDEMVAAAQEHDDDPGQLVERPPVVTFLGHVDHGKTSLLDKIIDIDVVSGESGGITQHIRAYEIEKDGKQIAFVDTPGHEAFTEMRARGANVTDIAVLVVAADDGVMPQTEEAISHARAADVPIVVALNKMDVPGANPDRVYTQLAENDLLPAEWGGTTELVKTSAMTGEGMDELLDTLLTIAELHEYRANPDRAAFGTCLEAQLDPASGVVAKVIVQKGTLRTGDTIVCGTTFGRVKSMHDTLRSGNTYDEAGPSMPIDMTGLNQAPAAGEHFYVVPDVSKAREIAESRGDQLRQAELTRGRKHVTLETLMQSEVKTLNLIVRADVKGSIEAILKELTKLEHPEVEIDIKQATVGGITEADVYLADATDAIIIGFNVVPDDKARVLADQRGVQVRRYEVIYKVTEDLRAALEGMLEPEKREVELARVLVKQKFVISRIGTVAGCHVLSGTVLRNARARVIRDSRIIGDYAMDTLRREKEDVREVRQGYECGIKLAGFNDVKEGDQFEVYRLEEFRRTFD